MGGAAINLRRAEGVKVAYTQGWLFVDGVAHTVPPEASAVAQAVANCVELEPEVVRSVGTSGPGHTLLHNLLRNGQLFPRLPVP